MKFSEDKHEGVHTGRKQTDAVNSRPMGHLAKGCNRQ